MRAKYKAKREANIDEWRARELAAHKYYASKDGFIERDLINTLWATGGACYLCTAPLDPNLHVTTRRPSPRAAQTARPTSAWPAPPATRRSTARRSSSTGVGNSNPPDQ